MIIIVNQYIYSNKCLQKSISVYECTLKIYEYYKIEKVIAESETPQISLKRFGTYTKNV